MRSPRLTQLEDSIRRIPGVQAAAVIGAETPSEIHIVASSSRSPKQLVRDIQSLASAGFGFSIDHRIVSIVRLEDVAGVTEEPSVTEEPRRVDERPLESAPAGAPTPPPTPSAAEPVTQPSAARVEPEAVIRVDGGDDVVSDEGTEDAGITGQGARAVLEQMIFGLKDGGTWAKVALRWPDGTVTSGVSEAGEAREVRARAAGAAFLKALQPYLSSRGARLEVEQVLLHRSGSRELVLVRAMFWDKGSLTPLAGSAIIHDDVATATVHALLHASNRKLIALTA